MRDSAAGSLCLPACVRFSSHRVLSSISRATGNAANSSTASMEGYTLEGTKKTGASKKRLAKVLAAVKRDSKPAVVKK